MVQAGCSVAVVHCGGGWDEDAVRPTYTRKGEDMNQREEEDMG